MTQHDAEARAREMLAGIAKHLDEALSSSPPSRKAILAAYAELQRATTALTKAQQSRPQASTRRDALEDALAPFCMEEEDIDALDDRQSTVVSVQAGAIRRARAALTSQDAPQQGDGE